MGMSIGFLVGTFGVLILSHAAYSTIQYRALLKITEEEFSGPPINVVMELIIGLVLCIWAALIVPGKFLSIHPQSEENRYVVLPRYCLWLDYDALIQGKSVELWFMIFMW
nr:membrane magnesium transporter [Ipomoea batatas]